jgi:hypothetical protein
LPAGEYDKMMEAVQEAVKTEENPAD